MTDGVDNRGSSGDDMAEYLQTFLDETDEQLDDLIETMLALEKDSANDGDLNAAFRLIHTIKGSAGMMGFDSITILTHQLENRFERIRSGAERLDESAITLVLRCIDYLRQCNSRLREGHPLGSSTELLEELKQLEVAPAAPSPSERRERVLRDTSQETGIPDPRSCAEQDDRESGDTAVTMIVRFRTGLQLADLKAQLIVARLSGLGEVKSTHPDLEQLAEIDRLAAFEIRIEPHESLDVLRAAADVDGVESIEFIGSPAQPSGEHSDERAVDTGPTAEVASVEALSAPANEPPTHKPLQRENDGTPAERSAPQDELPQSPPPTAARKAPTKIAETMRVDIDRLDHLLNLAGELVVNRARFVQIVDQISPELRKSSMRSRVRDFGDSLRRTITTLEKGYDANGDISANLRQLQAGLDQLEEQCAIWENGRRCIIRLAEAVDQLSRVSRSLQRGVLDTRMVTVGPLFNRFRRVVRDLARQGGKKVDLVIRGEATELDKRMIDELGDPLVHLVRNSIDHGLEPPDVRARRGKPETGTIELEARQSGNNVTILVRDDGGGIDLSRVRAKLVERQILSRAAADELPEERVLDYIWHPGFSTAAEITDVSGRGVGMDVVKTRISQLNGTVTLDSMPHQGTTFSIRLPLTLAIMNSLLVRLRDVVFSMPIDDVREIVSVRVHDIITVHGKRTCEVRGEFIPLFRIEDVFHWHGIDYRCHRAAETAPRDSSRKAIDVVILHAGGRTVGLCVDELLGSQDIVIKSLSDNFIHIPGLSGASILGDGSVCLVLDVSTLIELAIRSSRKAEEVAS